MNKENSIKQQLLQLEEVLLQPKIRKSPTELSKLLADDFIEFGSSGNIYSKQQIIDALQEESSFNLSINNFQIKELASNIILATYHITCHDDSSTQTTYSLRSSIWHMIDNRWQMVFHQGTPTKCKE